MHNDIFKKSKDNDQHNLTSKVNPQLSKLLEIPEGDITKQQKTLLLENLCDNNFLLNANTCTYVKQYNKAYTYIEKAKTNMNITTNLSGRIAKAKYFSDIENAFLVLELNKDTSDELFTTERHNFVNFYVSPLDLQTQALILTELNYKFHTVFDEKYRMEIVQCYIDRLKYKKNEKHVLIDRVMLYFESFYNNKIYYELDNVIQKRESIDIELLQILPFVSDDMLKQRLAIIYLKSYLYNHALPLFREIKMFDNVIKCYIGLDMEEEAKQLLLEEAKTNPAIKFEDRVNLQQIYLLLASLCNDSDYYDMAFKIYGTSEVKRLKALFLLDKDIIQSIYEFEEALKINRTERILFSYGCALLKNEDYRKAVNVYKELIFFDPNNYKLHSNLATCYFAMGDIIHGIKELRNAIVYNYNDNLVKMYVSICVKHKINHEIDILINHFNNNDDVKSLIQNELKENKYNI